MVLSREQSNKAQWIYVALDVMIWQDIAQIFLK